MKNETPKRWVAFLASMFHVLSTPPRFVLNRYTTYGIQTEIKNSSKQTQ